MKRYFFILTLIFCTLSVTEISAQRDDRYVIMARQEVVDNEEWKQVVDKLRKLHKAKVLIFQTEPNELLPQLQKIQPRYVAIVEQPQYLNRDYVINLNQLSRKQDQDIFADFLWGIITGYNASNALEMVINSEKPFVISDAMATITELRSGKWFNRFAWIDDHKPGRWGEKKSKDEPMSDLMIDRDEVLPKFYDIYTEYDPDLIVTAAHATEKNLEMPFSLGNIKAQDGRLYADLPLNQKFLNPTSKPRVYFAVGNCLIGNVNNTKESMAIAWMNGAKATTMIGYVVTTWHGRNGWGGLKYWVTNPGRYALPQAVYLNQQDLLAQLNRWNPNLLTVDYPYDIEDFSSALKEGEQRIKQAMNVDKITKDQLGFVHDRDVLAYYGDPKWDVRLQEIAEENDYTVTTTRKGKKVRVTITTKANFSLERLKGDKFKQEHVLDLPFSYFFPKRLKNPRLADNKKWDVALDENFLLIYNPNFEPNQQYVVELLVD